MEQFVSSASWLSWSSLSTESHHFLPLTFFSWLQFGSQRSEWCHTISQFLHKTTANHIPVLDSVCALCAGELYCALYILVWAHLNALLCIAGKFFMQRKNLMKVVKSLKQKTFICGICFWTQYSGKLLSLHSFVFILLVIGENGCSNLLKHGNMNRVLCH